MTRLADVLELVRAPAVLTVVGDTIAGAVAARGRLRPSAVALATSSACLYTAGMALNDYADAELDARERPERPIPSGRIARATALKIGAGLTALGIAAAFAAGRACGLVSLGIAGAVWTYDLAAKKTVAGPVLMAACRGLDVLMGAAGPNWGRAVIPAAAIAAHTAAVTALSRGEVHGTDSATAATAAMVSAAVAAAGVGAGVRDGRAPAAIVAATGYLAAVIPSQLAARRDPSAVRARSATRDGIGAMVPAQTMFAAGGGSAVATAVLGAVLLAARLVAARKSGKDVT